MQQKDNRFNLAMRLASLVDSITYYEYDEYNGGFSGGSYPQYRTKYKEEHNSYKIEAKNAIIKCVKEADLTTKEGKEKLANEVSNTLSKIKHYHGKLYNLDKDIKLWLILEAIDMYDIFTPNYKSKNDESSGNISNQNNTSSKKTGTIRDRDSFSDVFLAGMAGVAMGAMMTDDNNNINEIDNSNEQFTLENEDYSSFDSDSNSDSDYDYDSSDSSSSDSDYNSSDSNSSDF